MTTETSQIPIRIAIVGYGVIGPVHAEGIAQNNDTELVAIVDPNPTASEAARKWHIPFFSTIDELLSSPQKPEAAIICSPNHTHIPAARQLARAKVHVLIEKPLCADTNEGAALVAELKALEAETGVKALVGHHRRFNASTIAIKKVIENGSLGQIVAVNSLWVLRKHTAYFDPEWRRQVTAGPVLINMVHEVDLFHHFFGPIVRVQTEQTASRRGFDAEEGAAILFRFKSGVVATALLSDNAPSPYSFESATGENVTIAHHPKQDCYRIFGTNASLSAPDMTRWSYDGNGNDTKDWSGQLSSETLDVGDCVPWYEQLAHFVKVVRGQEKASCTPEAGLAAVRVCEAIKLSLQTKQAVDIDVADF